MALENSLTVDCTLDKPNRKIELLAPFFQQRLLELIETAESRGLSIALFEGYRSPERQSYLYEQGRTRPGKRVTRATAWKSWHQLSVAADVVFWDRKYKTWDWNGPWDKMHSIASELGFETLDWEAPHLQIRAGFAIDDAVRLAKSNGMLFLWVEMEKRLKKLGNP
jgi:hypothetical protein